MEMAKTRTPSAAARVSRNSPAVTFVEDGAETLVDELVGGEHLAAKVLRQEERGNDDASQHVAENDLQETHISGEGYAGDRDDGEGAGLG